MSGLARAGGLAYREAGAATDPAVLLVHGYPQSSYIWQHALPALAAAGWRALAPDLPGYGDSEPGDAGAGAWERHVEALERFVQALQPGPVALVMHDWGVMIGLRWACDHPGAASALVISDGGFFSDRRWHDLANVMRTPEEGEKLVHAYTREGLQGALRAVSSGMSAAALAEYWKGFADDQRRVAHLELYRSGDFDKLVPYEGRVAALNLPALILWGAEDRFAGVAMARRFHAELPGSELEVLDGAGHFVWDDEPEISTAALVDFLGRRGPR
ncbi:MAG TPA: alpha/beta fold hydrolase [Solirubrobacteraceae bacterium]|jgi:haloalkane dehalogenase|nr:alpha/beta fold hydrolase [Solirubrobacteraceae bacterium]